MVAACSRAVRFRIAQRKNRRNEPAGGLCCHQYPIRAAGLNLATVLFEDRPARQSHLNRLSKDEARRVAAQIARLPTLLRIEKGIDPGEA
jgi:hypothetical protein